MMVVIAEKPSLAGEIAKAIELDRHTAKSRPTAVRLTRRVMR